MGGVVALALAGLILRLQNLDLVSFRYDSAMAYDRARLWWEGGAFPWTGIENSLGFHNTGALIWLLMVPAGLSSQPEAMVIFQSLLWFFGVFPLAWACWLVTRSRLLTLATAAAMALLPMGIFAARGIWAQNILAPLFAWSLGHWAWLTVGPGRIGSPVPTSSRSKALHLIGVTAPSWYGAMIHMAAGLPASIITLALMSRRDFSPRLRLILLATPLLAGILSVPSLVDAWRAVEAPARTEDLPAHIQKFHAIQGGAPGLPSKLHAMLAAIPGHMHTLGADGGLHALLPEASYWRPFLFFQDVVITLTALAGLGGLIWGLRRGKGLGPGENRVVSGTLVAMILGPPLLSALLLSRPNGSYLAGTFPVIILAAALTAAPWRLVEGGRPNRRSGRWVLNVLTWGVIGLMAVAALYPQIILRTAAVSAPPWPATGQYYLSLREHRRVARWLATEGVLPGRIHHVSGLYFQWPYEVLLAREPRRGPSRPQGPYVVMEDIPLRAFVDRGKAGWLEARASARIGPVALSLLADKSQFDQFLRDFGDLPPTPNRTQPAP
jgi:hypothetical protein